jgi:exodeoxyribonuclease VIII
MNPYRTIHRNMPFDEYRALPGMNQSLLSKGRKSMADLRWAMDHPTESTDVMTQGSAFHCLTTEPEEFGERFIVAPKLDRRTKEGKAEWERIQSSGLDVLTQEQHANAVGMALAIRNLPLMSDLLAMDGDVELAIQWTDSDTGVLCKCRLDYLVIRGQYAVIPDLKSTQDARPHGFAGSMAKYGYGIQAAMYSDAVEIAFGIRPRFLFACAESSEPYLAAIFEPSDRAMYLSRCQYKDLLAQYRDCVAAGEWPGYPTDIQTIELPRWAED